jgi:hypothetical protein
MNERDWRPAWAPFSMFFVVVRGYNAPLAAAHRWKRNAAAQKPVLSSRLPSIVTFRC